MLLPLIVAMAIRKIEDTKRVIRSCKLQNGGQHNEKKK